MCWLCLGHSEADLAWEGSTVLQWPLHTTGQKLAGQLCPPGPAQTFQQQHPTRQVCASVGKSFLLCGAGLRLCYRSPCMYMTSRSQGAAQQAAQTGCTVLLPRLHFAIYVCAIAQHQLQLHHRPVYECCQLLCTMCKTKQQCSPPQNAQTVHSAKVHFDNLKPLQPEFQLRDACNS